MTAAATPSPATGPALVAGVPTEDPMAPPRTAAGALAMSERDARRFLELFDRVSRQDDAEPCEHGHLACSTEHRGPCLDEVLTLYPELADEPGH